MVPAFCHLVCQSVDDKATFHLPSRVWQGYQEGQHVSGWRLRLVFAADAEDAVMALLPALPIGAMAQLRRQQPLLGLELSLTEAPDEGLLQQVRAVPQLEALLLAPGATLPLLNRPGLLVMDMDSTAIEIECIDELAAAAGVGAEVAAVTEQAMQGQLDFEQSLRARVGKLKGADCKIIADLCARLPLSPGLTSMIDELQQHHWRTVVASGGFTPFVEHLKQRLSLDAAFANELVLQDGKFMGEVRGQVVDAAFKAATVGDCARKWQIADGQKVAIGDGANDIPMVTAADLGVAYHAKPKLAAAADAKISQLGLQVLPFFLQVAAG
ncbi:phosphoserine phosphatase SerB [Shewanella sp. YIC-542]|uniref:phosphoserine phosphatase SerB n=1 Tax=Shewanella mytili TaxID=3377111 RepID=UPI00398E491B